jgi:hypothetical protein
MLLQAKRLMIFLDFLKPYGSYKQRFYNCIGAKQLNITFLKPNGDCIRTDLQEA